MEPLNNLYDLFTKQLKDRFDSEQQQFEAFPNMMKRASSIELKRTIKLSIEGSRLHMQKLEQVMNKLHIDPVSELCEGSISMINETWALMERTTTPEVTDAALIVAIQHIHHYDIAGYGSLSAFARALDLDEIAHTLHDMLAEEKNLDALLKEMALKSINRKASALPQEQATA